MAKTKKRQAQTTQSGKAKHQKVVNASAADLQDTVDVALTGESMDDLLDSWTSSSAAVVATELPRPAEYDSASDSDESEQREDNEGVDTSPTAAASATTATTTAPTDFRTCYMDQLTSGFGNDLDLLRQEPGLTSGRLQVLIDSLETGVSLFDDMEKQMMLSEMA
ncbi:hypothetical protein BC940DRAFT_304220 [Gongronella butleri]|nr:hypothetical protein BC940DRAFT_304220 [Gongronella butleri]